MAGDLLGSSPIQNSSFSGEKARFLFLSIQLGLGVLLVWMGLRTSQGSGESGFGLREADRKKNRQKKDTKKELDSSAQEKILRIEGIRIDLPPHELLKVRKDASVEEIQKAYRSLMKHYHPDRVGPPGSRQWNEAQKIAKAINVAKEELLKSRRNKSDQSQ